MPNGDPKVIERFDCSGCGDLDMSKIVSTAGDSIVGLSGRTLKLSDFMKNSNLTSDYRLGQKTLVDLYPSKVRERIMADAKLKKWDDFNKKALSDVAHEVAEFEAKNPSL